MKIKDSTVISMLCLTWILLLLVVFGAEDEISRLESQVNDMFASQESQIADHQNEMEMRFDEAEARITDLETETNLQSIRLMMHRQILDDMTEDVEVLNNYLPTPTPVPRSAVSVSLSTEDRRNIAALTYLEAGSCSFECQCAIVSVIINRMNRYNKTASQVIWESGVFSPAARVRTTVPSQSCLRAVDTVIENGCTLPGNVLAFRNRTYHTFGRPYCQIDGVYFTAM